MNFLSKHLYPTDHPSFEVSEVTYLSDEYKVKALLVEDRHIKEVKNINIYLRGGKGQVGKVRLSRMLQFKNDQSIVAAPYYRGSNGGEGMDEFVGRDVNDVIQLIQILRDKYQNARVNLFSFSRGGLQALNVMRYVDIHHLFFINSVASIFQMYDERSDLRQMLRRMVGHPKKDYKNYTDREAILHDIRFNEVTIIHGVIDRHVDIKNARILSDHLKKIGIHHELLAFNNESHYFSPPAIQTLKEIVFDRI